MAGQRKWNREKEEKGRKVDGGGSVADVGQGHFSLAADKTNAK